MSRTRYLTSILIILILLMTLYYIVNNKEKTSDIIYNYILRLNQKKVIIPDKSNNHRSYLFKTLTETNDFVAKNEDDFKKIYYTILNNGWDTFTFQCDLNYKDCFEDNSEFIKSDYMLLINNYVSPYNKQMIIKTEGIRNEITVKVTKIYKNDEITKLKNKISEVLKKYNITKETFTEKDLERIHDYIINNTKYDDDFAKEAENFDNYNNMEDITPSKATGALFNKKAVCSGYTDAFALFLDELKVPNFKVESMSRKHVWNVIYYNKKWSHVDLTWDDDEVNKNNNRNFYMINTKTLLKKDSKEHNFDTDLYLELK